jgi:hypothetical protein
MNVRLDREFTGLSADLYFLRDGSIQRSGSLPDSIEYSGSLGLTELADLLELTPPKLISDQALKTLAQTGIGERRISYYVEPEEFKRSLKMAQDFCAKVFGSFERPEYAAQHLQNLGFINSMKPARIASDKLNACDEIKNRNALESFSSDSGGFMDPVRYSLTNSITGRSSVTAGPQILTTAKVVRSFLRSRYKDGCVLEIDFSSLEPRVALAIAGVKVDVRDVYDQVNAEILGGDLTRESAKLAVLSAMYGASERSLAESLPSHIKPRKVIESIRSRIGFEQAVKKIKSDMESSGRSTNYFGRPIISPPDRNVRDAVLFNWLIQSSAVDVALVGFAKLVESMRHLGAEFEPIFVIHDALLIDVREKHVDLVKTLCASGSTATCLGTFPLKVSRLG